MPSQTPLMLSTGPTNFTVPRCSAKLIRVPSEGRSMIQSLSNKSLRAKTALGAAGDRNSEYARIPSHTVRLLRMLTSSLGRMSRSVIRASHRTYAIAQHMMSTSSSAESLEVRSNISQRVQAGSRCVNLRVTSPQCYSNPIWPYGRTSSTGHRN